MVSGQVAMAQTHFTQLLPKSVMPLPQGGETEDKKDCSGACLLGASSLFGDLMWPCRIGHWADTGLLGSRGFWVKGDICTGSMGLPGAGLEAHPDSEGHQMLLKQEEA